MESQHIKFTLEEDPLLNMGTLYRRHKKVELDPGCDRTQAGL